MILVTSAAGKSAMAVIRSLKIKKEEVRAVIHRKEYETRLKELGVGEIVTGNMTDRDFMKEASRGVKAIYHIGPSASPDESMMGAIAIDAAGSSGAGRFVFHSVLHPQIPELTHHRQKLAVEEKLINSDLDYTILQPASYMQNILPALEMIKKTGRHAMPYAVNTRTSLVDLDEVGEVAAKILTEKGHDGATYELSGGDSPSVSEVAEILSKYMGIPVKAEVISAQVWMERARASGGLSEYSASVLSRMFGYYEKYGFKGNPNVLTWLLGRTPNTYEGFLKNALRNLK